jgi:hypothetical protein
MRLQLLGFLSILLLITAVTSAEETIPGSTAQPAIYGRIPPTERWIWYTVIGPRDRIAPVLYISTRTFKTVFPEMLLVVSPLKYRSVEQLTQSRFTQRGCTSEVSIPLPYYAVKIAEHHGGKTSSCIVSQDSACESVAQILNLPAMNWSPIEMNTLKAFASGAQCTSIVSGTR